MFHLCFIYYHVCPLSGFIANHFGVDKSLEPKKISQNIKNSSEKLYLRPLKREKCSTFNSQYHHSYRKAKQKEVEIEWWRSTYVIILTATSMNIHIILFIIIIIWYTVYMKLTWQYFILLKSNALFIYLFPVISQCGKWS